MKRDMELMRKILLKLEESLEVQSRPQLALPEYDEATISYHVKLMHQAGLVEATDFSHSQGFSWRPRSLTWAGHEFLDAARNDTVWSKAMTKLRDQAASVPFEVLKAVVLQASKEFFGV